MSSATIDALGVYFNEELRHERAGMRAGLYNGGPGGVARARAEIGELLRRRGLTHEDFWRATSVSFADDEEMYRELADAYRFFFDEEPPAPGR